MLWDEEAGNHADLMRLPETITATQAARMMGTGPLTSNILCIHMAGRILQALIHMCTCPVCVAVAGIAAADAISVALCLLAFLYMTKLAGRYVADVKPRNSARASDFTVLVRGLPDVTPADVSHSTSTRHLTLRVAVASWFEPNLDA